MFLDARFFTGVLVGVALVYAWYWYRARKAAQ